MNICFYFQVHQPFRLLNYNFFQIGKSHFYENEILNRQILQKIAQNCYLQTNALLLALINKYPSEFNVSFSISGMALRQFEQYQPEVILSFQALAKTGQVEFIGETFYHSLASVYSKEEFESQIKKHEKAIGKYFGQKPTTFRNTELIFDDNVAQTIEELGYKTILAEGVDRILKNRSPHQIYAASQCKNLKVLLRDHDLSDDISFRFNDEKGTNFPLTVKKFVDKLNKIDKSAATVNLFMDYETFGEHQPASSGIFTFLEELVIECIDNQGYTFKSPNQISAILEPKNEYSVTDYISWADTERDLSAWLSNSMQYEALHKIYSLRNAVLRTGSQDLIEIWSRLQTSDHYYYMCTKYWADGDVHKYFSPYNSPYDAYIFFMNVVSDFELVLKRALKTK
ncbi:MAG: glycoside hydrolase family 57 protein [Cytophagales bacterium]